MRDRVSEWIQLVPVPGHPGLHFGMEGVEFADLRDHIVAVALESEDGYFGDGFAERGPRLECGIERSAEERLFEGIRLPRFVVVGPVAVGVGEVDGWFFGEQWVVA